MIKILVERLKGRFKDRDCGPALFAPARSKSGGFFAEELQVLEIFVLITCLRPAFFEFF